MWVVRYQYRNSFVWKTKQFRDKQDAWRFYDWAYPAMRRVQGPYWLDNPKRWF